MLIEQPFWNECGCLCVRDLLAHLMEQGEMCGDSDTQRERRSEDQQHL